MKKIAPLCLLLPVLTLLPSPILADTDGDGFEPPFDCDDTDPLVFPGATDICDGKDNDCDDVIDGPFRQELDGGCGFGIGGTTPDGEHSWSCEFGGEVVCAENGLDTTCIPIDPPADEDHDTVRDCADCNDQDPRVWLPGSEAPCDVLVPCPDDCWSDADGDGLSDQFETTGIDVDCDGEIDLDLASLGADPDHKDIFVEIDYMEHHLPRPEAVNDLVFAFATAPVENPDGTPGITLHLEVDEEIPHETSISTWAGFDSLKKQHFGTVEQREESNAEAVLSAKRLAYHYSLWVHDISQKRSGRAEFGGNDFVVSLGSWSFNDAGTHRVGSRKQQAGTFMHELGHNLRFGHGGKPGINCKPNYLSVMSYTFQTGWIPNPDFPLGRLDYSSEKLPTLEESSLQEGDGISDGTDITKWRSNHSGILKGSGDGPLDWDGSGEIDAAPVAVDLNDLGIGGCGSSPGQTLIGSDDWETLTFLFCIDPDFKDGVHEADEIVELSAEDAELLANCLPGTTCNARGQGFWKRQCKGKHPSGEASKLPSYVQCVSFMNTFDEIDDVDSLCRELTPSVWSDKCEQAESQFMATLLNVCSGLVGDCCPIRSSRTSATRVSGAIDFVDRLLSNSDRSRADCEKAQGISASINEGVALFQDDLPH